MGNAEHLSDLWLHVTGTMSDDEADPELLELLRESLGLKKKPQINEVSSDTGE